VLLAFNSLFYRLESLSHLALNPYRVVTDGQTDGQNSQYSWYTAVARKIVCIAVSHIPCAFNKRRAYKLCEQDLRMFPMCCDADRFLENVTPSIFRLSTLAKFGSISEDHST